MFHKKNKGIDNLGPKMIFWIRMSEADTPISSANTRSPFRVTLQTVAFIINGFEIRLKSEQRLSSESRIENFISLHQIHSMKLLVISVVGHLKFLCTKTGAAFPLCHLAQLQRSPFTLEVQTPVLIRTAQGAKHQLPPDTAQQWENSLPEEASLGGDAGRSPNSSLLILSLGWKMLQIALKFSSGQNFLSSRAQRKFCTKTQTFFFLPSGVFQLFFFYFKSSSIKIQTIVDVTILASLFDHYKRGVGDDDDSCVFWREGQEF